MSMETADKTEAATDAAPGHDGMALDRLCSQVADDMHKAYGKARAFIKANPSAFVALAGAFGVAVVGSINARR